MRQRLAVMAATGAVAAALAGCSGGASPGTHPTPPAPTTSGEKQNTPTATPPSGAPPVRVTPSGKPKPPPGKPTRVGGLVLRLPGGWHVHNGPGKDSTYVTTGGCDKAALTCPGFRVMSTAQIKRGNELRPYKPGKPFYPATDVQPCPANKKLGQKLPGRPKTSGYGAVGDKQAVYYQWTVSCATKKKSQVKSIFYQWEWYLPQSRMLIVDQWSTGDLGAILKWAKFR
jgi:hypothetical protein